jgi:hypothetical protein
LFLEFWLDDCRDIAPPRAFEAEGALLVGNDSHHLRVEFTGRARIKNGLQVGAVAGNQDDDF